MKKLYYFLIVGGISIFFMILEIIFANTFYTLIIVGSIEIFFTLYLKYGYQSFDLGKYDKLVNVLRSYDEGVSEQEIIKRARLIYDKQWDEVIEESLEKLIELNPLIYGKIHLLHKIFPKQLNKVMKKKENATKLAKLLQQLYKIKLSSLEKERIHTILKEFYPYLSEKWYTILTSRIAEEIKKSEKIPRGYGANFIAKFEISDPHYKGFKVFLRRKEVLVEGVCKYVEGFLHNPKWLQETPDLSLDKYPLDRWEWRVGPHLKIKFFINDLNEIPDRIYLEVVHTGSEGPGEFAYGQIDMNDIPIASNYIPPNHFKDPDTFSIPKAFLIRGDNVLSFHLMGLYGYVWHILDIEANWE